MTDENINDGRTLLFHKKTGVKTTQKHYFFRKVFFTSMAILICECIVE